MTRPDVFTAEPATPPVGFSVREFARTARGSHRDHLELPAYESAPLDRDTLELVAMLARLERGALRYLRSVLVTPTHKDARVTGFLVTWAFEKFWVADALERVVGAHLSFTPPRTGTPRLRAARRALAERVEPIRESVVANLIGDDVVAVHCAAGAIDEWITQAAVTRLAAGAGHPVLTRTIGRLLEVRSRHDTFFTQEAAERLATSPTAARLARRRLRRATWPLGSAEEPPGLVRRLLGGLLAPSDLVALDARVRALPGLAGLDLVTRAVRRAERSAR